MKKTIYFIFCLLAFASFCCLACGKEEGGGTNEDNTENTEYAQMLVGSWMVESMTLNGEDITPDYFVFMMNADGTGLFSDNGETENNDFTWSVNGKVLTIVHRHGQAAFTITNINDSEATLEGNTVPGSDGVDGDVVMHLRIIR